MTNAGGSRSNTIPIVIGIAGILIELVTVVLLASKRLPATLGTPLIVAGMLLAFVPIFVLARRARQRR